jgi:DNA-binding transcriptional LysR family regulator
MHAMNLDAMDLNLLRVLDALLTERHVTRASKRLGLSQPATSHALARLRECLGDPLFVRTPRGLAPTARASELAGPLRAALSTLQHVVAGGAGFDPATAKRTFHIATIDYGSFVVVPALLERVQREAPGIDLWVRAVREDPFEQLASGEADVALGPAPMLPARASFHTRKLYEERFVCMARKGHPRVRKGLDLATWASLSHILVAPRGNPGGVVDEVLAKHGMARRVALAVPHFLVAPHVVASSDLVLTIGARVAAAFAEMLPVKIFEPPVPIPGFEVHLTWHARNHHDPAQQWLRGLIVGHCRGPAQIKQTSGR